MTGISGLFPRERQVNANFDWVDIASATGYLSFLGVNAVDTSGNNYILLDSSAAVGSFGNDNRAIATAPNTTSFVTIFTGQGAGPTKGLDIDFDSSSLQLPRTVEGDAFVGFTLSVDQGVSSAHCVVIFKKWDGASETTIGTVTSESRTLGSSSENAFTLKINLPRTHFKQGEIIRLTFEVWTGDSDDVGLFHIPNNTAHTSSGTLIANGSAGNTRFALAVPFRLDFL